IGIHTGEPLLIDGDYVGSDMHRSARICSAAHGGQVLVSQSTRDLSDADLRNLGEFRLNDLAAPERLFQLGGGESPPPRALGTGNLSRAALPEGLVTLVFTDIEGSTNLLRENGDAFGEILADHNLVLRESWQQQRGVEVRTEGD